MCATARRFAKRATTVIGRCSAVAAAALAATAHAQDPISLLEPAPGADAIAKKPEIRIAIATDYAPESLLVVLDGIDVTALVERTSDGVRYRPLEVLPSGDHAITVHLRDGEGAQTTAALQFSTRHSEKFDELASEVRLGVEVEDLAARRDSAAPRPSYHALVIARGDDCIASPSVPGLPTIDPGLHRVRFVLTRPAAAYAPPLALYFAGYEDAMPALQLHLVRPLQSSLLNAASGASPRFEWAASADVAAYRLS